MTNSGQLRERRYIIDVTYSPHDGGYYCEVTDSVSFQQIHTTAVFARREAAIVDALTYVRGL